jgi:hypothetical protein
MRVRKSADEPALWLHPRAVNLITKAPCEDVRRPSGTATVEWCESPAGVTTQQMVGAGGTG